MQDILLDVSVTKRDAVDGFPADSEMHRILDNFLRAAAPPEKTMGEILLQSAISSRSTHLAVAMRQAENDFPALLRAMNERVHWLAQHEPPDTTGQGRSMPWLAWCCDLGHLYSHILDRKPDLQAKDLAALCKADALGWLRFSVARPVFHACEDWITKNGFDPDLTNAMQEWQKRVYGSSSEQSLRKEISWLLWFDTTAPVNEKACWSAAIRKSLRTMPNNERSAWTSLLGNVCVGIAEKPTKKWLKPAEKLLSQIDAKEFQTRICAWFAPFKAGSDLKITITGRDILGALFWYSQLAKDAKVDEAVRWFARAKWKTKTHRQRTARLLPIWIHTLMERSPEYAVETIHTYQETGQLDLIKTSLKLYEELCRRDGKQPRIAPPPPMPPLDKEAKDAMMAKMMQTAMGHVLGGAAAEIAGDLLVVSNAQNGESYEIGLRDGRIVRRSDGKTLRLEIDWSRPPFGPFKTMLDSQDLADPFQKNYFRAMFCARVLSGAMLTKVPIVVDET
jgi:hypothetical protein